MQVEPQHPRSPYSSQLNSSIKASCRYNNSSTLPIETPARSFLPLFALFAFLHIVQLISSPLASNPSHCHSFVARAISHHERYHPPLPYAFDCSPTDSSQHSSLSEAMAPVYVLWYDSICPASTIQMRRHERATLSLTTTRPSLCLNPWLSSPTVL